MAEFYGTLKGNKGTATRCGSKASGIAASVQTYGGSLVVEVHDYNVRALDSDRVTRTVRRLDLTMYDDSASGGFGGREVYTGPLADLLTASKSPTFAAEVRSLVERHARGVTGEASCKIGCGDIAAHMSDVRHHGGR